MRLTIIGNLVADPELRFTPGGQAKVQFTVATNPRYRDNQGQFKDGDSSFPICIAWREIAENIAASFQQGSRVIVTGEWKQRKYTTQQGESRSIWELNVDGAGPDVRYGTAKFSKMDRSSAGAAPAGGSSEDPWATSGWPSEEPPRGL